MKYWRYMIFMTMYFMYPCVYTVSIWDFNLQLFLFADGKKKVQTECEEEWGAEKMGILPCV